MSIDDQKRLYDHMMRVIQSLDISDAVLLMAIASNPAHAGRDVFIRELIGNL